MSERRQDPHDAPPYDARAMLAAFRESRAPASEEVESLWTRLELDVAVDPLPSEQRAAAPWRVIFIAAGAIAAAFVLGWWLRGMPQQAVDSGSPNADLANRSTTPNQHSGVSTDRKPEPAVPVPVPVPVPEPEPEPESVSVSVPESPTKAASKSGSQTSPRTPKARREPTPVVKPEPDPPPPPVADTLAAEATAIRKARRALTSGSPASALDHLADYETRFPQGKLTEEADAVRTMARCTLQPDRATDLAAGFRKRHPASLQQSGVDRACTP